MNNEQTLQRLATELLLKPVTPTPKKEPTGARTQNRVYAKKENAIDAAKPYSNFMREDVYVYESTFGGGDFQYTLRTLSEIFSPDSDYVIHCEKYESRLPKKDIPPTPNPEK